MIFGENRKMSKEEKLGKNRAFLPRCGEAEGPERPPLEFSATKPLFTWAKIFIFFLKVQYSCTDILITLIND